MSIISYNSSWPYGMPVRSFKNSTECKTKFGIGKIMLVRWRPVVGVTYHISSVTFRSISSGITRLSFSTLKKYYTTYTCLWYRSLIISWYNLGTQITLDQRPSEICTKIIKCIELLSYSHKLLFFAQQMPFTEKKQHHTLNTLIWFLK